MRRTDHLLFQQTDIKILSLLRIAIGLWFFIDFSGMLLIGYVREAYVDARVHFPFYGFEWITPLPGWGMYLISSIIAVASLCIMLGYWYRPALLIFLLGQSYVFMLDIVYTLNKFYLFILLAGLLLCVPANRFWSLDVRWKRCLEKRTVPRWNIFAFQFMIGLIYTYSGISKLNPDWLSLHQPLTAFLSYQWPFRIIGSEMRGSLIALMTYAGLFFDLSVVWLLLYRKTNLFAHGYQISFHLLNFIYLGVGSLSIFMFILTLLLFPPVFLKRKMALQSFTDTVQISRLGERRTRWALGTFMLVMLLLPHRHYLIDNNVNWTEKGHRFSWRLMTRTKTGSSATFIVKDNRSTELWVIEPGEYLTARQYRKMAAETDLVIVFAHWLEGEWADKGYEDVSVKAIVNTRLNRKPSRPLIDPRLDLTKVSRTVWKDEVSTPSR